MLTEQNIEEIIRENVYADEDGVARTEAYVGGQKEAAKEVHSQHLAECERLMELAWEKAVNSANNHCYGQLNFHRIDEDKKEWFQDFKDSLNASGSSV